MILTYSGRSAPTAFKIMAEDDTIILNRGTRGDINWGRSNADTKLNPDTSNATNKRRMRELFAEHDVPMPPLVPVDKAPVVASWHTIIGRPDTHTKGRGFWICNSVEDVYKALRGTRKKKPATHFMHYIEAPREYRVHIFNGKSIRISEKAHTAFHEYTTIKPTHNVDHVRKAGKQAVNALGLDFGAVDILANDTECWVLEVNTAPGLGGTMPKVYAEAFKKYMEGV